MRVSDFVKFIEARERHREWREARKDGSKLRGADPIISTYRFCNVRRNDDRVTKWIHQYYMDYYGSSPYLWFALVVARLFNHPPTLNHIRGYVLPFKPTMIKKRLAEMKAQDKQVFNAAYIVSTNGRAMDKVDYLLEHVLQPMWKNRDKITRDMNVGQLANAHIRLCQEQGMGSFMAAQVLADWKYAKDGRTWDDFASFAASGPGSKRGLNRVMGFAKDTPFPESTFRSTLLELRDKTNAKLKMEPLTAQDIQNCLCEFDKYERARTGEGKPKQKYAFNSLPWMEKE